MCTAPVSSRTPSISMRSVPTPCRRAPIAVSSARQVADLRLARGVLDDRGALGERGRHHEVLGAGHGDQIGRDARAPSAGSPAPPRSRSRWRSRRPALARPLRCWSIGRTPIAQPPGSATRAEPWRATSGPSTSTEARMVETSSYGARSLATLSTVTVASRPRRVDAWRRASAAASASCGCRPGRGRSSASPAPRGEQRGGQRRQRRVLGGAGRHFTLERHATLDEQTCRHQRSS